MQLPIAAFRAGLQYLRKNPGELLFAARHAAAFRTVLPLDAFRWILEQLPVSRKAPQDVVIGARPPAITLAATIDLMNTPVRAGAAVQFEELRVTADEMRVTVRLYDLSLQVLGSAESPVAALIRSGALDLSRPGNLVHYMPNRPPVLVEAKDDRIVLDLMRIPKLNRNFGLRRVLGAITPVLVIREIRFEDDHLVLGWMPRPAGLPKALAAFTG